ncbi:TIGR04255 family protein [Streptomyces sp. NPDC047014]|uniref:TIGR04255 family protein n=1 Tax=Streptomyces sp. NPDC047014 TaxID=3155736 RepID=UPI0033D9FCB0
MTSSQLPTPFGDEPCKDKHLTRAPLARVLAQLRFEPLSALGSPNVTSEFAARLSKKYPYLETGSEFNLLIGSGQVSPQSSQNPVWRFRSPDRLTTVSLTNGSLALETTQYAGRTDFCKDLAQIADVLKNVAYVPAYTRVGYRYTNRISESNDLGILSELVRPEILGISAAGLDGNAHLVHSLSQAAFDLANGDGFLAQWGEMPANGTFDPSLDLLPGRSWILDLDAFQQGVSIGSDPEEIRVQSERLSKRAYRFFRWAVTPRFLIRFGG